jgi:hypothetical protein
VARHPGYPLIPRSNTHVAAGDYFAIPLRRGGWFCAGRVVNARTRLNNRWVTVGLLDWCEAEPPTSDTIAGAKVLDYGREHVRVLADLGGLLGHRSLEADGGLEYLLAGRPVCGDAVGTWSGIIISRAHARFGRHFPESPAMATERPTGLTAGG